MRVAIIPARGGSTRIPRKNIKDFHGKPIIAYSIEKALSSGIFDEVWVTTEDDEIAAISESYGAMAWLRNELLAVDSVGTQEVIRDCIHACRFKRTDIVCGIYATSPLMDIKDLHRGLNLLTGRAGVRFVFTVGTDPLHDAGQFYYGWAASFLDRAPLIHPYTLMLPISSQRDCDINTPDDWARAEKLYMGLPSDE